MIMITVDDGDDYYQDNDDDDNKYDRVDDY